MRAISRVGTKPREYYKGIQIQADTGLHQQIFESLSPRVGPGTRVLDFGSGQGALSQRFADAGCEVLSLDADSDAFKASTKFYQLDFNDGEAVERFIAGHEGAFDIVLGVEVIEHVENPWQYVRDLKRLLAPGGAILLSTPNVTSWYSRMNFLVRGRFHQFEDHDRAYGHINPIAEDELRLIAERSGLRVVSIQPGGWLPRLWLAGGRRGLNNLVGFFGTFLMRGTWRGWCIVAILEEAGA